MTDWKTKQPPFIIGSQPNKWGYLNNPRWMSPSGAPVSYNGREDEEPQIWTPDGNGDAGSSDIHFPCGHWHKRLITLTSPPTTAPPTLLLIWFSCPQAVVYGNGTDDIFFVTTDSAYPISTMYLIRYNRPTDTWTILYTTTTVNDLDGSGYDFRWQEPQVAKASRGNISVFGFARFLDDGLLYPYILDIFVFNSETLVVNNFILPIVDGTISPYYYSHWITVGSDGRIHVFKVDFSAGTSTFYDCVSDNNGVTFTPHLIGSAAGYSYRHFICVDSSNDIYVVYGSVVYGSVDNGVNWSPVGSLPTAVVQDFNFLNDAFFILNQTASTTKIYRSTDLSAWSEVLSFSKAYYRGGTFAYDGTYYYAILNYRDGIVHPGAFNPTGTNYVYRSADGINWSQVSSFTDDAELGSSDSGSSDISVHDDKLVYTYYYASTLLAGYSNVFMLSVWESDDYGVNWTPIQTPFCDVTTGVLPS